MEGRPVFTRAARFFKAVYLKLFRINDTPGKIALGVGLGVFAGVLPGAGPIAALGLAFIFRANRGGALSGSVLTNTWLSIPVFLLSLKVGSAITGASYDALKRDWSFLIKDFRWEELMDLGIYRVLAPILLGYVAVSMAIGMTAYVVTLIVVKYARRRRWITWN